MWQKRLTQWIGLVLIGVVLSFPSVARAGGGEILHAQNDQHAGNTVSSTELTGLFSSRSDQVADDFTLNCATSCQIDTILVTGSHQGANPGSQPAQVRVQFYTDPEVGIPGSLVAEYIVPRGSIGDVDTGNYLINLSPPLALGGGTWWLSIQAINTANNSTFAWTWSERVLASPSLYPSVWRNPGGNSISGKPCPNWAPRLAYCQYPFGGVHAPDQMFEITGNSNTGVNPTPRINRLVPPYVAPGSGDITEFEIRGSGFVSNSIVKWNGTPVATLPGGTNSKLKIYVPAAWLVARAIVPITVENPAPGGGSATRNFLVGTPVFLPVVRR